MYIFHVQYNNIEKTKSRPKKRRRTIAYFEPFQDPITLPFVQTWMFRGRVECIPISRQHLTPVQYIQKSTHEALQEVAHVKTTNVILDNLLKG